MAKLLPGQGALTDEILHLLATELVVNQTAKSNTVSESLEQADRVVEQHNRGEDQEDVLEHTGQGEDQRRRLADLVAISR